MVKERVQNVQERTRHMDYDDDERKIFLRKNTQDWLKNYDDSYEKMYDKYDKFLVANYIMCSG